MQEAFCRTWKYLAKGNTIDNLRAFLYKTANNLIIDESRKKKAVSLDQIMEKGFVPQTNSLIKTENYLISQEVLGLVETLDKKYRDVIMMKYMEDLSTKEISSILHETENNIYIRVSRGFSKIRKAFQNQLA